MRKLLADEEVREFAFDPAFVPHQNPVVHAKNFRKFVMGRIVSECGIIYTRILSEIDGVFLNMTLTIDLKPELEAQLQEESVKKDCDANALVVEALEALFHLKNHDRAPNCLSIEESVLLQKINRGLPESVWQEYHDLVAIRRAETLTPEEQVRLIALSDSISEAHAERLAHASELARLRQTPLETLLNQLEISPRKV